MPTYFLYVKSIFHFVILVHPDACAGRIGREAMAAGAGGPYHCHCSQGIPMTADPDAVTQSNDRRPTPGRRLPARDEVTRAGTRAIGEAAAADRPDRDAAPGPSSRQRLLDGTERRLTIVVGGAGFGKSTLAARVAAARPTAWYTLDASDRHIGALAAGVTAALRRPPARDRRTTSRTPSRARSRRPTTRRSSPRRRPRPRSSPTRSRPPSTTTWCSSSTTSTSSPGRPARCGSSRRSSGSPRPGSTSSSRRGRRSRSRSSGCAARARSLDLGGTALAVLGRRRSAALLDALLGDDRDHADLRDVAATRIHAATGGWPAAVRLALEAYRIAPGGDREAVLDRLQRPEGPIFAYLAEEVVAGATDDDPGAGPRARSTSTGSRRRCSARSACRTRPQTLDELVEAGAVPPAAPRARPAGSRSTG